MNFLPFGYLWLIRENLKNHQIKTILDLGCGKGEFGELFNKDRNYLLTGVEVYEPYIEVCRRNKKYKSLYKMDLTNGLKFKDKSVDAVVCLQVIEHLKKKDGEKLIGEIERIAKKRVILSCPVKECCQEEYDENIHQRHLSSWAPEEFEKKGYKVYGVGLKVIYGSKSHALEQKLWRLPGYFLSFLLNPVSNLFPKIAAQMIAVKLYK